MEDQFTYVWGDPYKNSVKRIEGETVYIIPLDEGNADYQAYLAWADEGNIPGPYPIPTPADGIEDLGSAKVASQDRVRQVAYTLLSPTDWVVVREMESGVPAPTDITAYRAAVRSTANDKVAAIESAGDLDDLTAYLRSDEFAAWPEPPTA